MSNLAERVAAARGALFRRKARAAGLSATRGNRLAFERLEPRLVLDGGPLVISEFLAINDTGLQDAEGKRPDWIEIHNPGETAVSLDGWYLTDGDDQWQFPDVSLVGGAYLVVFASGKDRPGPIELHTNFKLDGDGEYLALIEDDGSTVVHEYAPEFPKQVSDVSYGIGGTTVIADTLVHESGSVSVLIPPDDGLGLSWTGVGFDDSGWISGDSGVGYETETGGPQFEAKINFQLSGVEIPAGYEPDYGNAFADRGNGFSYGWAVSNFDGRHRNTHPDQRYDTLNHMQKDAAPDIWEIEVPNGSYEVLAVFGDPSYADQINTIDIEGTVLTDPDGEDNFDEYTLTVSVSDGRLTVQPAPGASNAKIAFIEVTAAGEPGYESYIETDVEAQMHHLHPSAYIREEFQVADASDYDSMTLSVRYDDGFVAYLNGVKIAEENAPASPAYNSTATHDRPDEQAVVYQQFDVTSFLGELDDGANVLAIHGLNVDVDSPDFLIQAQLLADQTVTLARQYFTDPTPGEDNSEGALGVVADTTFSVDRGFYDEQFDVEISSATDGADVRYTLDGSEPSETVGLVYSDPITIDTTTTLRAIAYKPGYISTNVDTQTYIFLDDVVDQDGSGLPPYASWGHAGPDWEVDPEIVAAAPFTDSDGEEFDVQDALAAIPSFSLVTDWDNWFGGGGVGIYPSGQNIERPVSMELIYPDGTEGFQINGSVMIVGGTSVNRWKSDKLSMRVKFKEPYGPTKLDFSIFGGEATDRFDTLVVDARLNQAWAYGGSSSPEYQREHAQYIRDQFTADIQLALGGYAPHGIAVHLYLNGVYWGLHRLHERPDEHFAAEYFGGDEADYYVLKHNENTAINPNPDDDPVGAAAARAAYADMMNIAGAGLSTPAQYALIQEHLDVPDFIDYMITNFYVGNTDWAHQNWYASKNYVDPDGRWRYHSWDAEHVLRGEYDDVTGRDDGYGSPTWLHRRLDDNAEYRMLFADHVHRHFFNDGLLTPEGAAALYQVRLDEIDRAVVGESARWGDNQEDRPPYTTYTRDAYWIPERDRLLNNYFPGRTDTVLDDLRPRGLYPYVAAPVFKVNGQYQHGGQLDPGEVLSATASSGTIFYTLDGSDPRLPGGALSDEATPVPSGSPISLTESVRVKTRVRSGSTWSALNEAVFLVNTPAALDNLAITEINYHPYDPTDEELAVNPDFDSGAFEFIELQNIGGEKLDLYGVEFTKGITFDFAGLPEVLTVDPGQYIVLVNNPAAFAARYETAGAFVAGRYSGNLNNGGEQITLKDRFEQPIVDVAYNDAAGWPGRADGKGATLELVDPAAVPEDEPDRTEYLQDDRNWRSSGEYGGTPGTEGEGLRGDVLLNEVLTRTPEGELVDAIELYNTTAAEINIGGWYLSDQWGWESNANNGDYKKFRIPPGTTIGGGGFRVFYEGHYDEDQVLQYAENEFGGGEKGFALSGARGDDVWLMEADVDGELTRFVDHVDFMAAAEGESFGRWPDGEGELYPMTLITLGDENSGPRIGPVVISEVHYCPDAVEGADQLEFVEIYNPTEQTVDLTDWRIRKGIDFDFAAETLLAPHAALVVLPFDPQDPESSQQWSTFCAEYYLEENDKDGFVGGYQNILDNGGETVQLQRADTPIEDPDPYIPHLLEDEVKYDDDEPWPPEPDGEGESLNRRDTEAWGNDYANWTSADPSPGVATFVPTAEVKLRQVFYNNSAFDGNNPAADQLDDAAVATDKEALPPDQTANGDNYTSYSRGINGIMIDIAGLANPDDLNIGNLGHYFEFHVGNSDDPSGWGLAPAPSGVAWRDSPDFPSAQRVTLVWPDYAIRNQWLQVTVLAEAAYTGLPDPDVFYFGNAVGESGDSDLDAEVSDTDVALARDNPRNFFNPAVVTCAYDYNRDARVNATDMLIAGSNPTDSETALKLIHPPALEGGAAAAGIEELSAHDAVLEQAIAREPSSRPTSLGTLAWLYEYEQISAATSPSKKPTSAEAAVDKLLATYWL